MRATIAQVLPRHRRWRNFLASLPLNPDKLPSPLAQPSTKDFIICGVSRSGTTLLTALLFQPPSVVTVLEPWDGMRLAPAELFHSLRTEIDQTGALSRGRLDLHTLREKGEVRWRRDGAVAEPVNVEQGFLLGVKWPIYWRFLGMMPDTKFLVCVRDPVSVVASFRKTGGRLGQGLDYETRFNQDMNRQLSEATRDPRLRRILLYDHVNERILPHLNRPNVMLVRFERWFSEPHALFDELSEFLGVRLDEPPVDIQPPDPARLSAKELRLIRAHCRTAESLGYEIRI